MYIVHTLVFIQISYQIIRITFVVCEVGDLLNSINSFIPVASKEECQIGTQEEKQSTPDSTRFNLTAPAMYLGDNSGGDQSEMARMIFRADFGTTDFFYTAKSHQHEQGLCEYKNIF